MEDTISILRGLKAKYELHHRVHITDGAIVSAALMSQRYLTERKLPDKAVDLIDEAAARLRMQQESKPDHLYSLERAILTARIELEALKNDHDAASRQRRTTIEERIRGQEADYRQLMEQWDEEKARRASYQRVKEEMEEATKRLQAAIREGDYNTAGQLKHVTIPQLQQRMEEEEQQKRGGQSAQPQPLSLLGESVTSEDVAAVVARHTGIPVARLLVGERERLLHMEEKLRQRVVGQDRAVSSISNCIRIARAGLHAHTKPMGCFLFLGPSGVGKCWAPGTQLRLFNGDLQAVETFVGGEQLMGSDGQPRIVTPGSVIAGQAPMYRIDPLWEGAESFTVNGAHILVLTVNAKPRVEARGGGQYRLVWWEVDGNNQLAEASKSYHSKQAAEAALARLMAGTTTSPAWEPLVWEVSVDEFLTQPPYILNVCKLFASRHVTFQPRLDGLHLQLARVLGHLPSAAQLEWAAWYLGVWVTDGHCHQASICQGSAPTPAPHHHEEVMNHLLDYAALFHEPVTQVLDQYSPAGHAFHWFKFGGANDCKQSIAHRLLQSYGLIGNKRIPQAWICDTLEVRRRIFAGVLDGDGYYTPSNVYEVSVACSDQPRCTSLCAHATHEFHCLCPVVPWSGVDEAGVIRPWPQHFGRLHRPPPRQGLRQALH